MEIKPANRKCLAAINKGLTSGTEGCQFFFSELIPRRKRLAFFFRICYACTFEMLPLYQNILSSHHSITDSAGHPLQIVLITVINLIERPYEKSNNFSLASANFLV